MRGNEKIKNTQDDRINVERPVILITAALIAIVGIFVWLGIRNPVIFSTVRDFLITFSALFFFHNKYGSCYTLFFPGIPHQ